MSGESGAVGRGLLLMTRPRGVPHGHAEPLIGWMPAAVAARLRALGFELPVELGRLPGKWWSIHADLAALGRTSEPGCGYARAVAPTEAINGHLGAFWVEILGGPFESAEDGDAVYLASQATHVARLGAGVTVKRISTLVAAALKDRELPEPVPLTRLRGMFWVCGLSGGWCSTAELDARIRSSPTAVNITHGPFEREEDAHYAFDVMWESPE